MKIAIIFSAVLSAATSLALGDAKGAKPPSAPTASPPPPIVKAEPAPPAPTQIYAYEQRPMGGRPYLVTPDQAQAVVAKFKEAYARAGSPRILIYVNRDLIDEESGLKLSARREQVETTRSGAETSQAAKVSHKNTYRVRDRKETALADRQTTRDVERLFGRPLRLAGASLVDQNLATQMLGGKPLENFVTHTDGEQARREREAISKLADVVLEVLISSRNINVAEVSGDKTYTVPDIQATALRLNDSKIIGQATAADLLGRVGSKARYFDVREVTEATALSLMEDMTLQ